MPRTNSIHASAKWTLFNRKTLLKLLLKAIILTIGFVFLGSVIGIILPSSNFNLITYFTTPSSITNLALLLILMVIYDYFTAHKLYMYENLIAGVLVSMLLGFFNTFTAEILLSFLGLYVGLLFGRSLRHFAIESNEKRHISGAITFLLVLWIVFVFSSNNNSISSTLSEITRTLQNNLASGSTYSGSLLTTSIMPYISTPTEIVTGVATQISTSGNGGSATILTSSGGTQTSISWTNNQNIPYPYYYLGKDCKWSLSGTILISVTECIQ